jgi:ABC-type glycerol-3-phosphate transport system substrate-binding protein
MKNFKKTAAVLLAATVITLSGCGQAAKTNVKLSDVNHVFTQTEITLPGTYDQVSDSEFINGKFYLIAISNEMTFAPIPEGTDASMFRNPNGDNKASDGSEIPEGMFETNIQRTSLVVIDESGNVTEEKELSVSDYSDQSGNNSFYSELFCSPEGKLLSLKTNFTETGNKSVIVEFDESLRETEYFDLSAAMETIPSTVQIEKRNTPREFVFDDTYAYALTYEGLIVFDKASGKYQFSQMLRQGGGNSIENERFQGLYNLGGTVAVSVSRDYQEDGAYKSETLLKVVDPKTQTYGAQYDFAGGMFGNVLPGNTEYPLIIASGSELYSYNYLTGEKTLLIDFLASGTTVSDYNSVAVLGSGRFAVVTTKWNMIPVGLNSYSGSTSTTKIIIFDKVDPADIKERELITIYNFYSESTLLEFAADFNRKSTEYEIDIKSYSEGVTDNSYNPLTALNNDIISGNIPDILIISSGMPYDSYAKKGLLADLNKYLEKDDVINKNTINPYILKALETDGKLYSITKNYTVNGLIGKTSIFGNDEKLTAEKIREAAATYPEAALMGQITQDGFINIMVGNQLGTFVNSETGEVSFNSPEFIELLNLAKTLPADYDRNPMDYRDYESIYMENRALIRNGYITDFRSLVTDRYQTFGEDIVFMGFPNPNNSGITLSPVSEMAVMSGGSQDAAWEVVKSYMLYESDAMQGNYGLPILTDKLNAAAAAAAKPITYTDPETGELKEVENMFWSSTGQQVKIPDNTEADNQRIFDLIADIGGVSRYDEELMKIIEEETAAFLAGSKTAEECATLIDNRAATYAAESK